MRALGHLITVTLALGVGVVACDPPAHETPTAAATTAPETWTCGMHPDVVQHEPGRCPACNMALVPKARSADASTTVRIDPVVQQNMGLRLGEVIEGRLSQTLRLLGTVRDDGAGRRLDVVLFDRHRQFVRAGQQIRARFASVPGKTFRTTVDSVGTEIDPATRTVVARAALPDDERLLPGMYATAEILALNLNEGPLVPREAVIDSGLRQIVFVALGEGRFAPREVELGTRSETWAVVEAGLEVGEPIVVSGQFLLDSESRLQEALEKHRTGTWEIPIFTKDSAH